jgi:hypothetical protein
MCLTMVVVVSTYTSPYNVVLRHIIARTAATTRHDSPSRLSSRRVRPVVRYQQRTMIFVRE